MAEERASRRGKPVARKPYAVSRTSFVVSLVLITVLSVAAGWWLWQRRPEGGASAPQPGGRLVATFRSEPASFNRLVSPFLAEDLVTRLTQGSLVRLNRATGELEPRLAREWTRSDDGLTWTVRLVEGVRFSDGEPFTSADVLFSFQALYDERVASEVASSMLIDGRPLTARALDAHTVVITFPAPYGPGLEMLDPLPILPRHRLVDALERGEFRTAWGVETPLDQVAGLGPFRIAERVAGERLVFRRNPHFWRTDDEGRPLPYLDEIELQIVPDRNAEVLRLQAGEADLVSDAIRPEDHAAMARLAEAGRIRLERPGVTINPPALWFNLGSEALARKRPWLASEPFRRGVSHAVDRQAIVSTIYLGEAVPVYGPVTPGHGDWHRSRLRQGSGEAGFPSTPFDLARARALFAEAGLVDRDDDGMLEDGAGREARFSIMTGRGDAQRERTVSLLQEQLRRAGIAVDVVSLEVGAMVSRWAARDYDAMYFWAAFNSFEPALDYWMSSGSFHFWNPNQPSPATPWEAEIDELMRRQASTLDRAERLALFARAQRVLAEHLPVLYFAAPEVVIATSARVRGAQPSVLQPAVLWNAEELSVR